jgi:hypothetical protein
MSKEMTLIILGLLVSALPFLGIYSSWKTPLFVVAGLFVMLIGFLLRGETLSKGNGIKASQLEHKPFVESTDIHSDSQTVA